MLHYINYTPMHSRIEEYYQDMAQCQSTFQTQASRQSAKCLTLQVSYQSNLRMVLSILTSSST